MKRLALLSTGVAGLMLLAAVTPTLAADNDSDKGKSHVLTITGEAKCAKCALHESDKCQTVIEAKDHNGRMVKFYLADNDVAKKFHKQVCQEPEKVTAVGSVKRLEDGKRELTVTKIELAKGDSEKSEKKDKD